MSAERLFDPTPYGKGNEREPHPPKPKRTIRAGTGWGLVVRKNKQPAPEAHRRRPDPVLRQGRWEGAYTTRCGITSAKIDIPVFSEIVPCPKCELYTRAR